MFGVSVRIQGLGAWVCSQAAEPIWCSCKGWEGRCGHGIFSACCHLGSGTLVGAGARLVDGFCLALVKENIFAHTRAQKMFSLGWFFQGNLYTG